MYVPFYTKSNYSLLSSLLTIDDIIEFALKNKQTSCVLCDSTMYGVMEFITKCKKKQLKPIIGLEIDIGFKVLCYAKDYQGYQSLMHLFTMICDKNLSLEDLTPHLDHLLIILPYESREYVQSFDTNYPIYIGYKNLVEEEEVKKISSHIVFLRENLYLTSTSSEMLSYLYMIRDGKTIYDKDISSYDIYNHSLEIKDIFSLSHQEGLKVTNTLASSCEIVFPKKELELAIYPLHGVDEKKYLEDLSKKGLWKRLGGKVPKSYETRLLYELSIINKMGFANYFLVVYDFIRYSKKQGILVGPGRGSAAGSLVAYSLGITEIDPIHYDLLFERFLNPERVTMPDIDTGATRSILKRYCTI